MPAHIALVDDEAGLRETVGFALRREGYRVTEYADGLAAWQELARDLPDLAVLDILMPQMDGLELCRRLRALSARLPILFLTSRVDELDRVLGLELGADEYLCKPFSMRELVARVRVLLRRAALISGGAAEPADPADPAAERILETGGLRLDLRRYQARWKGAEVPLTVTEFALLHALARHPGHVKTRAQLLAEAYADDAYVGDRTIDTHMLNLRAKVEADAKAPRFLLTVHGVGYRLVETPAAGGPEA